MSAGDSHNELSGSAAQVVQAGSIGSVTFVAPQPQAPAAVPLLTDLAPNPFVNRGEQIREMDELVPVSAGLGRPVVVAVRGMPGVGKTGLLRHVAARLADRFDDGVLYAAFGPHGETPSEALARFLVVLGVPEGQVPSSLAGRRDLYRSLTARSRLLVVLDDVTDAAQVEVLLPNSAAAMVLVAGNIVLEELHIDGAVPISLDPLAAADALDLLKRLCGAARADAEPDAAMELVGLCGYLPLAIRVVGARLNLHRNRSLATEVERLRDTGQGDVLARVAGVFDAVYDDLAEPVRQVYRALGVLVTRDFSVEVLAAALDAPVAQVRAHVDQLCAANLLEERPDGHYSMHRLVRGHALRRGDAESSRADRIAMLRRAVRWWCLGAAAADVAATGRKRLRVADPDVFLDGQDPAMDARTALAWFDREHANIEAAMRACAEQGWHDLAWRLFESAFAYYEARKPLAAWIEAGTLAVEAAVLDGDTAAEVRCRCLLAKGLQETDRHDDAAKHLARARELARDDRLRASTYDFSGNLALRTGRFSDALDWFTSALEINRALGLARGTALQTLFVGRALTRLARHDEAGATLRTALRLAEAADEPVVRAKALIALADLGAGAGDLAAAEAALADAADLATALDNTALLAEVAVLRARAAHRGGDTAAAARHRAEAIAAFERMGSPRAARLLVDGALGE
ncbi:NB-ARC domain-containing protein [Actinokineospora iranica]|nr:NB-ARC domain-containing protein [Actinokineospora iranica]